MGGRLATPQVSACAASGGVRHRIVRKVAFESHRPFRPGLPVRSTEPLLDASRVPRQTEPMTSTRISLATASRAMPLACVAARALGVASTAAHPVVDASRSPAQGPPALH